MDDEYYDFCKAHKAVILSPGNIISMTVLNRGTFRTKIASGMNGKTHGQGKSILLLLYNLSFTIKGQYDEKGAKYTMLELINCL